MAVLRKVRDNYDYDASSTNCEHYARLFHWSSGKEQRVQKAC